MSIIIILSFSLQSLSTAVIIYLYLDIVKLHVAFLFFICYHLWRIKMNINRYAVTFPYLCSPRSLSLCGTGNEYRPKCCDALRLVV